MCCLQSMQQSLQERLEKVWKSLHMSDSIKLDMAIKYSGDTYHTMLEQVGEVCKLTNSKKKTIEVIGPMLWK